jgi:hypothetical protein
VKDRDNRTDGYLHLSDNAALRLRNQDWLNHWSRPP